jgi:N-acetylglucosamine malate deacetylase 1
MIRITSNDVLVLAPHPDDESFGCGGTIKQIASSGGNVDVVFMTRGENGAGDNDGPVAPAMQERLARQRSQEAGLACGVLGVRTVIFLPGRDGHLSMQPELSATLLRFLGQGGYRSVFCPWPLDGHPDHAATFDILAAALRLFPRPIETWLYEVWTPLEPNMVIPIDSTIDAKLEAMRAHASQRGARDYSAAFLALAQYRSLFYPSSKYAEAFYTCDSRQLIDQREFPWPARRPPAAMPCSA